MAMGTKASQRHSTWALSTYALVLLPWSSETISTTSTPHISRKYAPQICHQMGGRTAQKSFALLQNKGTFAENIAYKPWLLWHTNCFYWVWGWSSVFWSSILLGQAVYQNCLWSLGSERSCPPPPRDHWPNLLLVCAFSFLTQQSNLISIGSQGAILLDKQKKSAKPPSGSYNKEVTC